MKNSLFIIFSLLILTTAVYSQNEYNDKLFEEIVKTKNGKYYIEDCSMVSGPNGNSIQVKFFAEAPKDVIGRDNFVQLFTSTNFAMIYGLFEAEGVKLSQIKIDDLDSIIGEPDLTINITVAKNGVQTSIKTDKGSKRITRTWKQIFEDE